MSGRLALGAAVVACALFTGDATAQEREVTVGYPVTTRGLDVRQPAGAHELYSRLKHAARVVCTHGMRVGLKPVTDEDACFEKSLAEAVRTVKLPLVTQVYLETHTLRQAAARGIGAPIMIAEK